MESGVTDHIVRTDAGGVVELRLARPDKKNALTAAMYDAMTAALGDAMADAGIVAVLLTADGGDFCAGNDINDFLAGGGDAAGRFIRAIASFGKPLVAAVRGQAVGIGTTMLLHCDLVFAAPGARFVTPFAKLGLVPEAGSSLLLPRHVGPKKAAAMLLLGEPLVAEAADGLVTAIVADDALDDHARATARAFAAMPPAALAETRRLMRGDRGPVDERLAEEERAFKAALKGSEAREAFTAFVEKRAPVFSKEIA